MRNETPYGEIHIKYDNYSLDGKNYKQIPVEEKMQKKDKISLFVTACILGFCVLAFYYFGDSVVALLRKSILYKYYMSDQSAFFITQMIHSLLCIFVPFSIGGLLLKPIHKERDLLPLNKTKEPHDIWLGLGIGFVSLVVSNYLTSFFVLATEHFGFYFETAEIPTVETPLDFFWQVAGSALVPALVEEFSMRGIFMQSMRKYGDKFAIVSSAIIFALLHGNMVQAPFAFILGCIIGWVVVVTDSLWVGIAIHFMNNFYAVAMNTVVENVPTYVAVFVFLVINGVGVALGIYSFIRFNNKHNANRNGFGLNEPGGNTVGARMKYRLTALFYTLLAAPMTIALIILIQDVSSRVHFIGS